MARLIQCDMCGKIENVPNMINCRIGNGEYELCKKCADAVIKYMDIGDYNTEPWSLGYNNESSMPKFVRGTLVDYRNVITDIMDELTEKFEAEIGELNATEIDIYSKIIKSVNELKELTGD